MVQRDVVISISVPGLDEARSGLRDIRDELEAIISRSAELRHAMSELRTASSAPTSTTESLPAGFTRDASGKLRYQGRFASQKDLPYGYLADDLRRGMGSIYGAGGFDPVQYNIDRMPAMLRGLVNRTVRTHKEQGVILSGSYRDLQAGYSSTSDEINFVMNRMLREQGKRVIHTHASGMLALSPTDFLKTPLRGLEHEISSLIPSGEMMTARIPARGVPNAFIEAWKSVSQKLKSQYSGESLNKALTDSILDLATKHGVDISTSSAFGGMGSISIGNIRSEKMLPAYKSQVKNARDKLRERQKNMDIGEDVEMLNRRLSACNLLESILDNVSKDLIIAVDEHKNILGALLPIIEGRTAHIESLASISSGVGTELLDAFERKMREIGITRITLIPKHSAEGFYERMGYKHPTTSRMMEKELGGMGDIKKTVTGTPADLISQALGGPTYTSELSEAEAKLPKPSKPPKHRAAEEKTPKRKKGAWRKTAMGAELNLTFNDYFEKLIEDPIKEVLDIVKADKAIEQSSREWEDKKRRGEVPVGEEEERYLEYRTPLLKEKGSSKGIRKLWIELSNMLGKEAVLPIGESKYNKEQKEYSNAIRIRLKETLENIDIVEARLNDLYKMALKAIPEVKQAEPEATLEWTRGDFQRVTPKGRKEREKELQKKQAKDAEAMASHREQMDKFYEKSALYKRPDEKVVEEIRTEGWANYITAMEKWGKNVDKEREGFLKGGAKSAEALRKARDKAFEGSFPNYPPEGTHLRGEHPFSGYARAEKEFGPYKEASLNIGNLMDNFLKKGGALSSISWKFASVAMSSMGVYFSIMGIVRMIQQGISTIWAPLSNLEDLLKSIALSTAFTPELGLVEYLQKLLGEDYMDDFVKAWQYVTGLVSTITGMLAGFGAKVFLDPEVQSAIQEIITMLQNFLLDPTTFELVKEIIIAMRDAMPNILDGVRMIGRLIRDWFIPHAKLLAFAWALSLVIQPLVSIVSFFVNIVGLIGMIGINLRGLLGMMGLMKPLEKVPMMFGMGNTPYLTTLFGKGATGGGMADIMAAAEAEVGGGLGVGMPGALATGAAQGAPQALTTAEMTLGARLSALGARLAPLLTNPITIAVAAALATIGIMWFTNFAGFRDTVKQFIADIKPAFAAMGTAIRGAFDGIGQSIRNLGRAINELWEKIFGASLTKMLGLKIQEFFLDVTILIITISEAVETIFSKIGGAVDWLTEKLDYIAGVIDALGLSSLAQAWQAATGQWGMPAEARVAYKRSIVEQYGREHPVSGAAGAGPEVITGTTDPLLMAMNNLNDISMQQLSTEKDIKSVIEQTGRINYQPYSALGGGPLNTGGLRPEDIGHVYAGKSALETSTSINIGGTTQRAILKPNEAAARVMTTAKPTMPTTELDRKMAEMDSLLSWFPRISMFATGNPIPGMATSNIINRAVGSMFGGKLVSRQQMTSDLQSTNVAAAMPFDETNTILGKSQREQEEQTGYLKDIADGITALNSSKSKATAAVAGAGIRLGPRDAGGAGSRINVGGGAGAGGTGGEIPGKPPKVPFTNVQDYWGPEGAGWNPESSVFETEWGAPYEPGGMYANPNEPTRYNPAGEERPPILSVGAPSVGYGLTGTGGTNYINPYTPAQNRNMGWSTFEIDGYYFFTDATGTVIKGVAPGDRTTIPPGAVLNAQRGGFIASGGLVNTHAGEVIGPLDEITSMIMNSTLSAIRTQAGLSSPTSRAGDITSAMKSVASSIATPSQPSKYEFTINIYGNADKEVTDEMMRQIERRLIGRGA